MPPIEIPTLNFMALGPQIAVIITAALVMMFDLSKTDKRVLGYGSLVGLGVAAVATLNMFDARTAPTFQDMAISDGFSLVLNLIFLITAALAILMSLSYLNNRGMQHGEYYALLLFATAGMMLMGAATDLIVVFLGLEIMSISLYILAAFNRRELSSGEAGMKYFILGAFTSAFFLYGVAFIYGATGSTNLQEIGSWFTEERGNLGDPIAMVGLGLLLVGFAFKIAAVPFQWWTPDVYHGAPTSVTAFMSVGAKAAGFAALVRMLMVSFNQEFVLDWQIIIALLAIITMTVGNVAALAQKDVKRMLAYSSVAHAGYLLVGVAAGTPEGIKGILFYLMTYTFMNIGAFAVVGVMERYNQTGTPLNSYVGLSSRRPLLAAIMAMFMFSLTGLPPFGGFWGKWYVFTAAVNAGFSWLAVVGMFNSAISAFYYIGVNVQMYMRSEDDLEEGQTLSPVYLTAPVAVTIGIAAIATLILGIWPTPMLDLVSLGTLGADLLVLR